MELEQFVSEDQVFQDIENVDRDDALHEMLDNLVARGCVEEDQVEPLLREIVQRETLGTTAIGRGVAVPHARMEGFQDTLVAVGMSDEGVEFHALDGEPVHAIFLVLGSESESEEYIDVMKSISELVQTDDFRRFLFRAEDDTEVVDLMEEMAE